MEENNPSPPFLIGDKVRKWELLAYKKELEVPLYVIYNIRKSNSQSGWCVDAHVYGQEYIMILDHDSLWFILEK